MKGPITIIFEGIVVGLALIIFAYASSALLHYVGYPVPALDPQCSVWNDTKIMEASLFVAGFLFHLTAEYTGVNSWYVRHYYRW